MSYEPKPLYQVIKITKPDLFAAVCIGIFFGACLWTMTSSALSFADIDQDCSNGGLSCPLQVKPVRQQSSLTMTTNHSTVDNLQTAADGVNAQRTTDPQALPADPAATVPLN